MMKYRHASDALSDLHLGRVSAIFRLGLHESILASPRFTHNTLRFSAAPNGKKHANGHLRLSVIPSCSRQLFAMQYWKVELGQDL